MNNILSEIKSQPEKLRSLDDFEFEQFCEFESLQLKPLFTKGKAWVPDDPQSDEFRLKILDGPNKGNELVVPHIPRPLFNYLSVLVEERLIRTFSRLADSILADMIIRYDVYSDLWESFGEYEVYEKQLKLTLNRERLRINGANVRNRDKQNITPTPQQVYAYRQEFASKIMQGSVKALSYEQIHSMGFDFFGVHYDSSESVAISALPSRFRSSLSFVTNSSPLPDSPYQFSLGYAERKWLDMDFKLLDPDFGEELNEAYRRGDFGVKLVDFEVAMSPALAPDMQGWTPNIKW